MQLKVKLALKTRSQDECEKEDVLRALKELVEKVESGPDTLYPNERHYLACRSQWFVC